MTAAAAEITPGRKIGRPRGYICEYRPHKRTRLLLADVIDVLDEYRDHWPLTVRQIFYRLVARNGYPKTEAFYSKLCHHLANARRGKVIHFRAIRDDGISTTFLQHFDDDEHFHRHVRQLGENYKRNKLAGQDVHLEVWCEAAGMLVQLSDVADDYSVRVFSSSGFDSLTAKKELADRLCRIGKPAVILHLGDYDPSGESIFRSISEDVSAFVQADRPWATIEVEFERVALTAEQVEEHDLPTAPAKVSDTRSRTWAGQTCQLEALAPDEIAILLRNAIEARLDLDQLHLDEILEEHERQQIVRALPAPGSAA